MRVQAAILLMALGISTAAAVAEQPVFAVSRPTIVAFFPPVTEAQLDSDLNEVLADFQLYAARVREPLRKAGVDFRVVSARSFQIRVGDKLTTFHPGAVKVGYYFIAPGKKPLIEYGVATDLDLLATADNYFGVAR